MQRPLLTHDPFGRETALMNDGFRSLQGGRCRTRPELPDGSPLLSKQ